jgi:hypothetical protein
MKLYCIRSTRHHIGIFSVASGSVTIPHSPPLHELESGQYQRLR